MEGMGQRPFAWEIMEHIDSHYRRWSLFL